MQTQRTGGVYILNSGKVLVMVTNYYMVINGYIDIKTMELKLYSHKSTTAANIFL